MADDVVVAGAGMTAWGTWGRSFVDYGVEAARQALADAGVAWTDIEYVAGGETVRNGYAGYVAGASIAQALGWTGAQLSTSYGACASGTQAIDAARTRILAGLCDLALVVGADTTPKGFLAPNAGDRPDDPDWLRFRLLGATNPTYFALAARHLAAPRPGRRPAGGGGAGGRDRQQGPLRPRLVGPAVDLSPGRWRVGPSPPSPTRGSCAGTRRRR